jgi:DNA-binding CsgD family transcriptional regulator/PAS domain-containing protein
MRRESRRSVLTFSERFDLAMPAADSKALNTWLESLRLAVDASSLSVLLAEAPSGRVLALSKPAAATLGISDRRSTENILPYITNTDRVLRALELVARGDLDGYQAHRELRSSTGAIVDVRSSARVVRREGPIAYVVSVQSPGSRESDASRRRESVTGCAGTVNDEYHIEHASTEAAKVLGRAANELLLASLMDLVHPADVASLVRAFETAAEDNTEVSLVRRFSYGSDTWRSLRFVIRPIDTGAKRFGFMLTPVDGSPSPDDAERITVLEQRLRRIAQEVQAAGVLTEFAGLPTFTQIPGLDGLTARQLEITSRLSSGQRVPAIAKSMYLSQSTVRNHLSMIFKKVHVHSQSDLLDLLRRK